MKPEIVVVSQLPSPLEEALRPWGLQVEDGTTATHIKNIGVEYERARRKMIAREAQRCREEEAALYPDNPVLPHPLWVYYATSAAREERAYYRWVFLSDQDRELVRFALARWGPASSREIVWRLNGMLGQRQTRRALQSLVSRGAVRAEVRQVSRTKRGRVYEATS